MLHRTLAHASVDVLVVSTNEEVLDALRCGLAGHCTMRETGSAEEAMEALATRPLRGLIVDGTLRDRSASQLSRVFLQHQPVGRVAIIAAMDDPSTLVGLALRDPRVEVLFRPIDQMELRACLLGIARMEQLAVVPTA